MNNELRCVKNGAVTLHLISLMFMACYIHMPSFVTFIWAEIVTEQMQLSTYSESGPVWAQMTENSYINTAADG